MTTFIQSGFVGIDYPLDHPRIGWRTFSGTAIANASEAGYPASNALDVRTALGWRAPSVTSWIGVDFTSARSCSYCGIAGHDLGTQAASYVIERWNGSAWVEVVAEQSTLSDEAIVFLFGAVSASRFRLKLTVANAAPRIGHIRFGAVTELPRRAAYAGTTPISESRRYEYDTLRSNGGAFMGRSIVSSSLQFAIDVKHLSETWRRSEWADFRQYANTGDATFFYTDRPASYPEDVAYAWSNQALSASRDTPNKAISGQFTLQCEAL